MLAFEPASRPGIRELAAQLQRCSPEGRSARHTRVALVAAALLVLAMSALFVFQPLRIQNAPLNPALKSIAVLPFENLSPDPDNAYFADGVQDEILTTLARIADLKVIGRTSMMQYKSGIARDLDKIGHQLGSGERGGRKCASVPATACVSTRSWSMRAATGSYGDRSTTGILWTYSQFKARSLGRLSTSSMQNSRQARRAKWSVPQRTTSLPSISSPAPSSLS